MRVFDDTPEPDFPLAAKLERLLGPHEGTALSTEVREVPGGIDYNGQPFKRRVLLVLQADTPIMRVYRSGRIVPYAEEAL